MWSDITYKTTLRVMRRSGEGRNESQQEPFTHVIDFNCNFIQINFHIWFDSFEFIAFHVISFRSFISFHMSFIFISPGSGREKPRPSRWMWSDIMFVK
jgi:hypothetical protein